MDDFSLKDDTDGYWVVDQNGQRQRGPFKNKLGACGCLGRLQKKQQREETMQTRACMCCGQRFLSEGIHHRLCSRCRHRSDGALI